VLQFIPATLTRWNNILHRADTRTCYFGSLTVVEVLRRHGIQVTEPSDELPAGVEPLMQGVNVGSVLLASLQRYCTITKASGRPSFVPPHEPSITDRSTFMIMGVGWLTEPFKDEYRPKKYGMVALCYCPSEGKHWQLLRMPGSVTPTPTPPQPCMYSWSVPLLLHLLVLVFICSFMCRHLGHTLRERCMAFLESDNDASFGQILRWCVRGSWKAEPYNANVVCLNYIYHPSDGDLSRCSAAMTTDVSRNAFAGAPGDAVTRSLPFCVQQSAFPADIDADLDLLCDSWDDFQRRTDAAEQDRWMGGGGIFQEADEHGPDIAAKLPPFYQTSSRSLQRNGCGACQQLYQGASCAHRHRRAGHCH
jgi:hypothetical protein